MYETPLLIKALRPAGDRVHQNSADSGNFRSLNRAQYGIAQESWSNGLTLQGLVDSQAADNHYRYRIRHVPPHASGCVGVCYRADCKCVVPDHSVLDAEDIGSRRAAFFVRQSSPPEPIIERGFPALKMRKIMIG